MEYNGIFTYHTVNGDTKDLCVQLLKFLISVTEGGNLCKHQSCIYQMLGRRPTAIQLNPLADLQGGPYGPWHTLKLAKFM